MIYGLFSFIVTYLYPTGTDLFAKTFFGITFLLNIVISLVMLPLNIRLAAQLIMQVFKYRYILKRVAPQDEDSQVMTGYYQHFKTIMCIILSMVCFNVFSVLSAVYFIAYILKSDWGEQLLSKWTVEGLCAAFEECVFLFAFSMLYQVACYIRSSNFNFLAISIVILLRMVYVSIQVGIMVNLILGDWLIQRFTYILEKDVVPSYVHVFFNFTLYFILPLVMFEALIRVPMIFSIVRRTQREVTQYINKFRNDIATTYLDDAHFANKINAGRLFKIAGWGTIFVSFLISISTLLQYMSIFAIFSQLFDYPTENIRTSIYLLLIVVQIVTILPSILYLIFLIILWNFFRNKTKVKYSGYSINDPIVMKMLGEQNDENAGVVYTNQDALHHTYYKHKNKIILTTYIITIFLISIAFSLIFVPLLGEKSREIIRLKPGDYYLIEGTKLQNAACPDSTIYFESNQADNINCSQKAFVGIFKGTQNIMYKNYTRYQPSPIPISSGVPETEIWIPKNSSLQISNPNKLQEIYFNIVLLIETDYPCYFNFYRNLNGNLYGLNLCQNITKINRDISGVTDCQLIYNDSLFDCKVEQSGVYQFGLNYTTYRSNNILTIMIKQFVDTINESTQVPFTSVSRNELTDYDVITYPTSGNITNNRNVCTYQAICSFHLALKVFIPIIVFVCSILYLSLSIVLIYKI